MGDYTQISQMVIDQVGKLSKPLTQEQQEVLTGTLLSVLASIDMIGMETVVRNITISNEKERT